MKTAFFPSGDGVYANAPTDLSNIDVYGFDYDFTLATYNESTLHPFIYNHARDQLVLEKGYPKDLLKVIAQRLRP